RRKSCRLCPATAPMWPRTGRKRAPRSDRPRSRQDRPCHQLTFSLRPCRRTALIPNATMLVQRREWEAGMDPDTAARRGFDPSDFDLGHKLRLVDCEHDVFGDGLVVK